MRQKLNLVTLSDVQGFVSAASKHDGRVFLTDKDHNFIVNAKSMLGAVYTLEWDEIWCEADGDIYHLIEKYVE